MGTTNGILAVGLMLALTAAAATANGGRHEKRSGVSLTPPDEACLHAEGYVLLDWEGRFMGCLAQDQDAVTRFRNSLRPPEARLMDDYRLVVK